VKLADLLSADAPATITVEQAADVLGVSRGLAYEACRRGEIPTLRLSRRVLVPVPRLLAKLGVGLDAVEDTDSAQSGATGLSVVRRDAAGEKAGSG
jgi:excisionase family DNA binding protein